MCLPVAALAVLTLATTAISAYSQYQSQKKLAESQAQAVQFERATDNMDADRAIHDERERAAAEANAHAQQANRDMAAMAAMNSEFGGNGRNMAALGIQQGQDLATIQRNSQRAQTEIGIGDLSAGTRAANSLASIRKPSALQAGLTIANAGLQYGMTTKSIKAPATTR